MIWRQIHTSDDSTDYGTFKVAYRKSNVSNTNMGMPLKFAYPSDNSTGDWTECFSISTRFGKPVQIYLSLPLMFNEVV